MKSTSLMLIVPLALLLACDDPDEVNVSSGTSLDTVGSEKTDTTGGSGGDEVEVGEVVALADPGDLSYLVPLHEKPPFIALYSARHAGYNDNFWLS